MIIEIIDYRRNMSEVTRESVLALIEEKEQIEIELAQMKVILDTNSTDMTQPLVDSSGFPRNDIDVYQVRHARNRIIYLRNDHTALMKRIEEGLHVLHSKAPEGMDTSTSSDCSSDNVGSAAQVLEPIVRVNLVSPKSPAEEAGIKLDDLIVQFGSVNCTNFKSLQDIGAVVKYSKDKVIDVTVKRDNKIVRLHLTPRAWSGQGLLGCNIIPVDSVDR